MFHQAHIDRLIVLGTSEKNLPYYSYNFATVTSHCAQ